VSIAASETDPVKIPIHPHAHPVDGLWHQIWWQDATAVVLVLAVGVSLYWTGIRKGEETVASASNAAPVGASSRANSEAAKADIPGLAASTLNASEAREIIALQAQLQRKATDVAHLENKRTLLEGALRAIQNSRDVLTESSYELSQKLTAKDDSSIGRSAHPVRDWTCSREMEDRRPSASREWPCPGQRTTEKAVADLEKGA
jgi:hypothetical protein